MEKSLYVVDSNGEVDIGRLSKIIYLLILSSLVLITSLAFNDLARKILEKYIKHNDVLEYFVYVLLSLAILILFVYVGVKVAPDLTDYMNFLPLVKKKKLKSLREPPNN